MTKAHHPVTILLQELHTLPTSRRGAVAIRQLELSLAPYPAYFREVQVTILEEIRESHPEAAEELERALESASLSIEAHCAGLRMVSKTLNDE